MDRVPLWVEDLDRVALHNCVGYGAGERSCAGLKLCGPNHPLKCMILSLLPLQLASGKINHTLLCDLKALGRYLCVWHF